MNEGARVTTLIDQQMPLGVRIQHELVDDQVKKRVRGEIP